MIVKGKHRKYILIYKEASSRYAESVEIHLRRYGVIKYPKIKTNIPNIVPSKRDVCIIFFAKVSLFDPILLDINIDIPLPI